MYRGAIKGRAKPVATFTKGSLPLNFAPKLVAKPVTTGFATVSLPIEFSP